MATSWDIDRARQTYAVPYWSDGYVDVDTCRAPGDAAARA